MKKTDTESTILGAGIIMFGTIVMLALILAVSYGLIALATWAIFSCFGWGWSWQMALGIWFLAIFLRWMHKYITSHGKKD